MDRIDRTGSTCVGDLRLSSLDVGFDLRAAGHAIRLPEKFASVGLNDQEGRTWLISGSRDEMVAAIRDAGYAVLPPLGDPRARILALQANWDGGPADERYTIEEAICAAHNCREASIDAAGDVWINDPQAGHHLTAEQLSDLADTLEGGK